MGAVRDFFTSRPQKKRKVPADEKAPAVSLNKKEKKMELSEPPSTPPLPGTEQKYMAHSDGSPHIPGAAAGVLEQVTPCMTVQQHNHAISAVFHLLAKLEKTRGDNTRFNAYTKGALAIAKHTEKLTSGAEAKKLDGVGKAISEKLEEFLKNGTVRKIDEYVSDPEITAMQQLQRISGVGPEKAKEWFKRGIKSVDDVRRRIKHELTHHQSIGLAHLEDFEMRIPRAEMIELEAAVLAAIKAVNPGLQACAAGSYRRGAASSGDIDILIQDFSDPTSSMNQQVRAQMGIL